jgi:hypothetical protein
MERLDKSEEYHIFFDPNDLTWQGYSWFSMLRACGNERVITPRQTNRWAYEMVSNVRDDLTICALREVFCIVNTQLHTLSIHEVSRIGN